MKYMGSKARLAADWLPIILSDRKPGQVYVEPFSGGCNMIDKVPGLRVANDSNKYLQAFWDQFVHNHWTPPEYVGPGVYKIFREHVKNRTLGKEPEIQAFAGWIGICCSYRGKWFGGFAGRNTGKTGKLRDYQAEALRNVEKQKPLLLNVQFRSQEYNDFPIPPNSIIYCDPPYLDTTGYDADFDHVSFWNWARQQARDGHSVYVSEYQAPPDFQCVATKNINNSLSSNGTSGGFTQGVEKLFVYRGCEL